MPAAHSVLGHVAVDKDVRMKGTRLKSLADCRVQHGPVHPAIHPDGADEEVLLFDLLSVERAAKHVKSCLFGLTEERRQMFKKSYVFEDV